MFTFVGDPASIVEAALAAAKVIVNILLKKYLVLARQENSRLFVNDTLSLCHILYDSQRLPSKGSTCASIKENIQGRHRSASEILNLMQQPSKF